MPGGSTYDSLRKIMGELVLGGGRMVSAWDDGADAERWLYATPAEAQALLVAPDAQSYGPSRSVLDSEHHGRSR